MRGRALEWSEAHIEFLRIAVPGTPWATVHQWFEEEYSTGRSLQNVQALCKRLGIHNGLDGRIQPGNVPPNKGRKGYCAPGSEKGHFAKGHRPSNWKPVGSYRQSTPREKDGIWIPPYWQVKVAETEPARHGWRFLHRMLWEEAHGPILSGHSVLFIDGDTENVVLENLACVSRGVLANLNRHQGFSQAPAEHRRTILAMAQLQTAASAMVTGIVTAPDGVSGHLRDHCRRYGLEHGTVYARIRTRGWTLVEALTIPTGQTPERIRRQRDATAA